jgi:hypothetical protein
MSRLHLCISVAILAVAPLACSRQTASTNGETVTVDKKCGETACDGWSADPHLSETPGVAEACVRSTRQFSAHCDVAFDAQRAAKAEADCKLLARTHTEGAIPWLDCLATAPCGAPPDACAQTSTFGDELCASGIMRCSSYCSDSFRRYLDDVGARLKPAVLAAARTCATQKLCGEASACMTAWLTMLE